MASKDKSIPVEVAEAEPQSRASHSPQRAAAHPMRRSTDIPGPNSAQTIIAIAVVLTICYFAKLVIVVLLVSILLAFILSPLVALQERLRMPRPLGSAIALLLFFGLIYGALYFGYSKAVDFGRQLPKYSSEIKHIAIRFREQAQKLQKTTQNVLPSDENNKQTVRVEQTNWWDTITSSLGT